jgi:hypothetical protein
MARLTKYSTFKALKLDAASRETNLMDSSERQLAFEKFIDLLQIELSKKRSDNSNNSTKKPD